MAKRYSKKRSTRKYSRRKSRSNAARTSLEVNMKSNPGFVRRHKGKLVAALGLSGAIAAAYYGGFSVPALATLFDKPYSYVKSAIAKGKELNIPNIPLALPYPYPYRKKPKKI